MIPFMSAWTTAPERIGTVGLADGRALGWAAWGPVDGVPVLFFGGAGTGRSLGFGADHAGRLGVQLIAVERPGLGASGPLPGRTLATWAADVEQLAVAMSLAEYRIVGYSQGAPFALTCAAAGGPVAVAIVAGTDELQRPEFSSQLHPEVAGLVRAVAADPDGIEAAFSRDANAEMLWNLIVTTSSQHDLGIYTDPGFAAAFRRALDDGFAQGAAGYARDVVLATGRWPFDMSAITQPVDVWYGEQDASPVHSPDFGALMARRLPNAHRHVRPDAGGSILWTHAEEILTSLLSVG